MFQELVRRARSHIMSVVRTLQLFAQRRSARSHPCLDPNHSARKRPADLSCSACHWPERITGAPSKCQFCDKAVNLKWEPDGTLYDVQTSHSIAIQVAECPCGARVLPHAASGALLVRSAPTSRYMHACAPLHVGRSMHRGHLHLFGPEGLHRWCSGADASGRYVSLNQPCLSPPSQRIHLCMR